MSERNLDQMEQELLSLGQSLRWAPTPDLTSEVLASAVSPVPLRTERSWRQWALAAALLLVLIGGVLAASSTARDAVADFLGIDGLRIERGQPEMSSPPAPVLGTPTSLQDLHRWLPFEPLAPAALEPPTAVYLRILENGAPVGMLAWKPTHTLPEMEETGLGALLMEFAAPQDVYMLLKTIAAEGTVMETTVAGNSAFWIEGVSSLTMFGEDGGESRWSGNVLIWEQDGVGYRLESALSMEEAVAMAETLAPLPSS